MCEVYRSCTAMVLATTIGLAYGAVARYHIPGSGASFVFVAGISIVLLLVASLVRRSAVVPAWRCVGPWLHAGLAGFASFLVVAEAFTFVSLDSLASQIISALPFLIAVGAASRRGAWLAAFGAAGFFATVVAMLYRNRGGGGVGFYSIYCP